MAGSARTVTLNVEANSKAEGVLDRTAGASEAAGSKIGAAFGHVGSVLDGVTNGAFSTFTGGLDQGTATMGRFGAAGDDIGVKALKWGTGIQALGAAFTVWGDKEKASLAVLNQAIDGTGQSHEDYADRVQQAIDRMEKFGFTATETEGALTKLVIATNDPAVALGLLEAAAGKATVTGKGLEGGAALLAKELTKLTKVAGADSTKALKALESALKTANAADAGAAKAKQNLTDVQAKQAAGTQHGVTQQIALRKAQEGVTEAAAKAKTAHEAVTAAQKGATGSGDQLGAAASALTKKYEGLADAAANTTTGKLKAFKTEIQDQAQQLAQKFGPALAVAGTAAQGMGAAMEIGTAVLKHFKTARVGATGAQVAGNVATAAGIPLTWAALAPVLLIIAAAVALGIGIYALWRNWDTVWGFMKGVVTGVFNWVKDNWPLLLAILAGPFGLAVLFVVKNFGRIKDSIANVKDWVKENWPLILAILTGPFGLAIKWVVDHWEEIITVLKETPGKIADIAKGIGRALANPVIDGINMIIGAWNSLHFSVPELNLGPLGRVGGQDARVPQILKVPSFAEGGIATGPMLAMLGDNRSGKEVILPLERAGEFGLGSSAGSSVPVHTTIVIDGRAIARAVTPGVREELNRMSYNSTTLGLA